MPLGGPLAEGIEAFASLVPAEEQVDNHGEQCAAVRHAVGLHLTLVMKLGPAALGSFTAALATAAPFEMTAGALFAGRVGRIRAPTWCLGLAFDSPVLGALKAAVAAATGGCMGYAGRHHVSILYVPEVAAARVQALVAAHGDRFRGASVRVDAVCFVAHRGARPVVVRLGGGDRVSPPHAPAPAPAAAPAPSPAVARRVLVLLPAGGAAGHFGEGGSGGALARDTLSELRARWPGAAVEVHEGGMGGEGGTGGGGPPVYAALLFGEDAASEGWWYDSLDELRRQGAPPGSVFTAVVSARAAGAAGLRLRLIRGGARMVAGTPSHAGELCGLLAVQAAAPAPLPSYMCPLCGVADLCENVLRTHVPLYHGTEKPLRGTVCPICAPGRRCWRSFEVHLHNEHGPPAAREPVHPAFASFSWCVVRRRRDGAFLLTHEPEGIGGGYWLPAGRVDRGEGLLEAAVREAKEEAGVAVRVVGALRFNLDGGETLRAVFLAEPVDEERAGGDVPKSVPDFESCGAVWASVDEVMALGPRDFRGPDPQQWFPRVAAGARVYSVDTDAFRVFDATMRDLSVPVRVNDAEYKGLVRRFNDAWAVLKAAYPPEAFRE